MSLNRRSSLKRDRGAPETIGGGAAPALVFLALILAATTAIAGRAAIVSAAAAAAAAYASLGMPVNLRGLAIEGVRATIAEPTEDGRELLVTGEIVNLRQAETAVPNLRLTLRGEDLRELYVWTAREPKSPLGPRERVAFRARLAAPPAGVRDVLVKLAAPGDKASFTE
jgi:hypothetical protein